MLSTGDIYPVSDFNRKSAEHIKRVQDTKKPEVLTVNGKAAVVMVDPESYDQLTRAAELSRTLEQIAHARAEIEQGRYQTLDDTFSSLKERLKARHPDADL